MNEHLFRALRLPSRLAGLAIMLVFAGLVVGGCTALGGSTSQTPTDTVAGGRQVYVANCVACHGEKGDRVPVAPLNVKEFLDMRGDVTLVHVISEGKGVMPAWGDTRGGPLNRDQVSSVVAYLNAAAGRTSPTILASSGRTVYQQTCTGCHGDKGDRIPAVPLAAKNFLDSRTDAQLIDVINTGIGQMPAFGAGVANPLSEDQVRALVSYVRYYANTTAAEEVRLGRDLYVANCLACHGERGDRVPNVALASPDLLRRLGDGKVTSAIAHGSGVMPGFAPSKGGTLEPSQIGALLAYLKSWSGLPADAALVGFEASGRGRDIYLNNCAGCHGEGGNKVPGAALRSRDYLDARSDEVLQRLIGQGSTRGMPSWGQSSGGPLSTTDIKSLVDYLRGVAETGKGDASSRPNTGQATAPLPAGDALVVRGKEIYVKHCTVCHGDSRDKTATANLADGNWLTQRGDANLSQVIANGKGLMPSWGKERGGSLSQDDIAAVLDYLKSAASGQSTTGVPSTASGGQRAAEVALSAEGARGKTLYGKNCLPCHGEGRDKVSKAKLDDAARLRDQGDEALSNSIANGKGSMPAWGQAKGGPIGKDDMAALLAFLKESARPVAPAKEAKLVAPATVEAKIAAPAPARVSFGKDVLPILQSKCAACHGAMGGWTATSYASVVGTGDHKPVVKAGDPGASLLAQKIKGSQSVGQAMPPGQPLAADAAQRIVDWIKGGAEDN